MANADREDQQRLPPKVNNQDSIRVADGGAVLLNGFRLDLSQAPTQIFQYDLRFVAERTSQKKGGGEQELVKLDLARGAKNDVNKETLRRLHWQLFQLLLGEYHEFFGTEKRTYTYDCALLLFSQRELKLTETNMEFQMDINQIRAQLEPRCNDYIRRQERITAYLTRTGTVNVRNAAEAYIQGDRQGIHFLELLSSQRMFEQQNHLCFGNRFYEQESVIQLQGDPRILKSGMQKNARFVGDNIQNAQPILQVDPKKSAFFPHVELLRYLCDFFQTNPQQMQNNMGSIFERANKQVRGLVLQTSHLPNAQLTFDNVGLTERPASEITFTLRDGQQTTVVEHYQRQYDYTVQFPRLPCVIQRKPGRPGEGAQNSYYPIELLIIVQGQRVPIDKQTPKLTEQMIKRCQVLPADVPTQLEEQRNAAMLQTGNPFFRAHAIRVNTDQMKAEASILFPPAIQYHPANDRVEPDSKGRLEWKMIGGAVPRNRAFTQPATWPKTWAVGIVQNAVGMDQCRQFCEQLIRCAQSRGLQDAKLPQRVDHFEQTTMDYVREKFEFYAQHKCMFVLVFAPGKRDARPGDIHHVLKSVEQQFAVLTQHISPEIMAKGAGGGGGAAMVLENILMKTNLKLGGCNFNLVTSNAYKQASRNNADVLAESWMGQKRMFIGIDFSHAPPLSLFERQTGKAPAIPTVVGMSYSVGKAVVKMRGTYWMQTPRQTTLTPQHQRPFIDRLKDALRVYQGENDTYPDHLIVFRGGASEGEFQRISFHEGEAFVTAFKELAEQQRGKFQPPAVTILVCQRQSNYRIIPERVNRQARAPDQNCQPGTVVDKGVMNAALTEFLLIGHKALQGTAQPVRCSVVHEWRPNAGPAARIVPQLPVEELENIFYSLCYSHAICAMSTALPGMLYGAMELAKRGRNNWKMFTGEGANAQQFQLPPLGQEGDAAAQAQAQLDEERGNYYANISQQLNPTIPTKFWA